MNVTPKLENLEQKFGKKGVRMELDKQLKEGLLTSEAEEEFSYKDSIWDNYCESS